MLDSLLPSRGPARRVDRSPFSSPFNTLPRNPPGRAHDARQNEPDPEQPHNTQPHDPAAYQHQDSDYSHHDEDCDDHEPLLPIFSSAHLDELPLYTITHAIRILVVQKCETTLSWDQLRSPQISQFLVKPIQSHIRTHHFNRATMSALLANCLQFAKEAEINPGNIGISRTRAILCELLAMRLLKDFSARELIDALSYDFNPLQGMHVSRMTSPCHSTPGNPVPHLRGARISAVEIAIRATAKRFLAHPLVVQQLQAIWAGSIVFHSAADNLHRLPSHSSKLSRLGAGYGTVPANSELQHPPMTRRTVTLYDPRDASLFKLSRLRVPRYRQTFSTLSFSVMLGLYLAVLLDRSLSITPLEVLFWFWSTGYMLDELVGFNEQGFGLYIMSVWNAFDLGILILFFAYYILRLYGILMPDVRKHTVANMAYDVLASTAVLLFPRAFSVVDNYRYFSQLLIAFRMMAQDLAAVLGLIVVSCSGFFVAFTTSFPGSDKSNSDVVYTLFQIVMGYTPAAWNNWAHYNVLGKIIMAVFLIICHFLIVTILITVLTNSFMAIVQNGNEEHQFLLAVNTISMVKSDALFSYVAPTNILAWLVSPFRYVLPFRQFVKFNRTIIKMTHFPILLLIFLYERVILSNFADDDSDYMRHSRRGLKPGFLSLSRQPRAPRLREPSIVSYHKDRALDEMFRQPFQESSDRTPASVIAASEPGHPHNVVDTWIQRVGDASPPMEQPQSVLDRLETRRPLLRRTTTTDNARSLQRDFSTATRSVISDPEDRLTMMASRRRRPMDVKRGPLIPTKTPHEETDADGDDELHTNDEGDTFMLARSSRAVQESNRSRSMGKENVPQLDDYDSAVTPGARPSSDMRTGSLSHAARARLRDAPPSLPRPQHARKPGRNQHIRNVSNETIVLNPGPVLGPSQSTNNPPSSGIKTPVDGRSKLGLSRSRPNMGLRGHSQATLRMAGLQKLQQRTRGREPSFNAIALDLASDLGDNRIGPDLPGTGNVSVSFGEQVFLEMERNRSKLRRREEEDRQRLEQEEKGMVGRIMLARMNTLEEGFKEMLKEVKDMHRADSRAATVVGPSTPLPSSAHSWLRPGTPLERATSNSSDTKSKRNPKKLFRRSFKGKEVERPVDAQRQQVSAGRAPSGYAETESIGGASVEQTRVSPEADKKRSSVIFRGPSSDLTNVKPAK